VVIFGLGMRYYLRVMVGSGFGLINLVLLYSEYLYIFSVEPFVKQDICRIEAFRNTSDIINILNNLTATLASSMQLSDHILAGIRFNLTMDPHPLTGCTPVLVVAHLGLLSNHKVK